jgi:hypothetical protein
MRNQRLAIHETLITIHLPLLPVLGLVIVHDQAGVNNAGDPA